MEYFTLQELLQFRLVCRKWRDSISQVPISIVTAKYKPENIEKFPSLFNIKSLMIYETTPAYQTITLIQKCKNISKIEFNGDLTDVISFISNPQLLKCIRTIYLDDFPFEKLVNLKHLE
jgi:hypothetical protein